MDNPYFEHAWQKKLGTAIDRVAGEATRHLILEGGEGLNDQTACDEIFIWTRQMLSRAEAALNEQERADVFTACACRYPAQDLIQLQEGYARDRNVASIMTQLQERFEHFLRKVIELPPEYVDEIAARGWGVAGRLQGSTILATKIPKSGNLFEYMQENDPERRRALYCHCPRVRAAIKTGQRLSRTYCYCGAGYYKDIWETIIDRPVTVDVISSVLAGDDTCTIAIHLPPGA